MGQKAKRICLSLMLTGVFWGCVTPAHIQRRVEAKAATLPQPEGVELLAETTRDRSGSDCITIVRYRIYASQVPVEEVFARYRDTLLKAGWEELPVNKESLAPRFREMQLGIFRQEEYFLDINRVSPRDAILFAGLYDQRSYIESKSKEFGQLLLIALSLSGPCPEARSK